MSEHFPKIPTDEDEDEQVKSYEDEEFGYSNITNDKKSPATLTILAIIISFTLIVVGVIAIESLGLLAEDGGLEPILVDDNDIPVITEDSELITLIVTDQKPSALSHRDYDWVEVHMDHLKPNIKDIQATLHWAKDTHLNDTTSALYGQPPTLELIETEILEGAKLNNDKITVGEQIMLEIINWARFPEQCKTIPPAPNCAFMEINYYEDLYHTGEITRDEYWLNIKPFVNQTTIDEVEGNAGT